MTAAVRSGSSTLRDTAIVLSTTLLGLVGSLGTQSCLAWFLEPVGRGSFAVCVTFALVSATVFGLATDRAVQYHLIARDLPAGRATATAFATVLFGSAVAMLIGWLLIGSSHPFFAKAASGSFRLSLLMIPLYALNVALGLLLAGVGRFGVMGALNLVSIVLNLVFTVLLVGVAGQGVNGAIWALLLSYLVTVALQSRAMAQSSGGFEWPRLGDIGRVVSYGLRFYVARLGNVLNLQVGTIVMAWMAAPAEIGVFAATQVLISRVMVIPDSISTALQPRVGPDANGQPELVAAAARASLVSVGAALAALLATAGSVVPILLSEAFSGAVSLLWWMAPGMWLKAATKPTTAYFIGVNRPGVVSLSVGVELATNAVAMLLLYRRYGLAGAAAATTVACLLASLVLAVAFHAVSGMGVRQMWRLRRSDFARFAVLTQRLRPGDAARAQAPAAARLRSTELLPGRVVKYRCSELITVEAEKTARAGAVGATTGLFRVPQVLAANPAQGSLATERFDDLTPLHGLLLRGAGAEPLLVAAGRALAAVHRDLALPDTMRRPLPAPWAAPEAGVDVVLHGDFNTLNLFVRRSTGELVLTDWETSYLAYSPHDPVAGEIPTVGPRYFDLAWFLASLFRRTWLGFGRIPAAPGCAEIFLRSYFASAGSSARPEGFAQYLAAFPAPLAAAEAVIGVSWRYWLRHPRAQTVSYGAMRALARSLAVRRPERAWRPVPPAS